MKKVLSVMLAVLCVLTLVNVSVFADNAQISMNHAEGFQGDQVTLDISITGNPGMAYTKLTVEYDETQLEMVGVENTGVLKGTFVTSKTADVNPYVLQWSGAADSTENGVVARVTFKIKDNAAFGVTPVTLKLDSAFNQKLEDVAPEVKSGYVKVLRVPGQGTITMDRVEGAPGEEVELDITITGNPGIAFLNLKMDYNAKELTLVRVENTGLLKGTFVGSEKIGTKPYVLQWSGAADSTADGVIAKVFFRVASDATPGVKDVTLTQESCFNEDLQAIQNTVISGAVIIPEDEVIKQGTIVMNQVSGKPGEEVTLDISITENPGIAYLKLAFNYDATQLTLVGVENTGLIGGSFLSSENTTDQPYVLLWVGASNSSDDGVIAHVTFRIADDATPGVKPVSLELKEAFNQKFQTILCDVISGAVIVSENDVIEQGKIVMNQVSGRPGEEVTLDISITENPGIAYLKLAFNYDATQLTLVGVENTGLIGGSFLNSENTTDQPYVLLWVGATDSSNDGVIAHVTFRIADDATPGFKPVSLELKEAFNQKFQTILCEVVSGGVNVLAKAGRGDISLNTAEGYPGDEVTLDVTMNANPGVAYLKLLVDYDATELELIAVDSTGVLTGTFVGSANIGDHPYVLQWAGAANCTATGVIATLTFRIKDGATPGEKPVTLALDSAFDQNTDAVAFDVTSGSVTVLEKEEIAQLSLNQITGMPGDEVTLNLTLSENPDLAALSVLLDYDHSVLEIINVADGGLLGGTFTFSSAEEMKWTDIENAAATGVIATITFKISEDAEPGTYPVTFVAVSGTNQDGETVATETTDGAVRVVETHKHELVKVEKVDPTCTEAGNIEYYICSICGTIYADAEGTVELTKEETVLPALGHKPGESVITPPTCEEKGYERVYCERCGELLKETVIPALEHDWDDGEIITPPTATTPGEILYTCKNDPSHTRTETIPPTNVFTYYYEKGENAELNKDGEYDPTDPDFIVGSDDYAGVDEEAYDHFVGIMVDGEPVPEDAYTIEETEDGSVSIKFTEEYLESLEDGDHTITVIFDNGEASTEFTVVSETTPPAPVPEYTITDGDGSEWTKGSDDGVDFTVESDQGDLTAGDVTGVLVDGEPVPEGAYTIVENEDGTITVELTPEYLESLEEGDHTITIVFEDGEAEAGFTVSSGSVTPPAPTPEYTITDGDGSEWTKGSDETIDVTIESNQGDLTAEDVIGVWVDGKPVPEGAYTIVENEDGTITVQLTPEYLETLGEGEHSLTVIFEDGSVETSFTIKAAPGKEPDKKPAQTGDNLFFIIAVSVVALGSCAAIIVVRRRREDEEA